MIGRRRGDPNATIRVAHRAFKRPRRPGYFFVKTIPAPSESTPFS